MKILVTGATGFIGRHVVNELLSRGHNVIAVARNLNRAQKMPWINKVKFIKCDLHNDFKILLQEEFLPNAVIHLAWPGLPNYLDFSHIKENLPADLIFLEAIVKSGVPHLLVAGTCLEYGMQYGPLTENMNTFPTTPYGLAKDTLCKSLQFLHLKKKFVYQWIRLFYMYGEGQSNNSLIAQLDSALDEGKDVFNMSWGDQLRDYLPIKKVSEYFALLIEHPECHGVINCSSGKPVSVFDLVQNRCREKGKNIKINRGYYPYPDYEPFAFWGIPSKLEHLAKLKN